MPTPDVELRRLRREDLPLVSRWLRDPRVARWWAEDPSAAAVEARYGPSIDGTDPTEVFVVSLPGAAPGEDARPFALVQRYRFADEADYSAEVSAVTPVPAGALSIDYLVGEADLQGRGLGPTAIAAVVADGWARHPDARDVLVPVAAGNRASWRALETAGFTRVAEGPMEPDNPVDPPDHYVYRLSRPREWR
ncbi:GNAT family N-acetyltransferase [Geodermatophilus sp. CPCC 206100]|uniref:GNAT family N-acetyltransferase n=1 Tax=Geodermatophilus sp. CPCC 206100 TaxID=3020054 RepID=UPI003B009FBF